MIRELNAIVDETSVTEPSTLAALLDHRAWVNGQSIAYRFLSSEPSAASITYHQLAATARTIAVNLLKACQKSDRVLLLFPPGLELIQCFMGCMYAGVVPTLHAPPTNQNLMDKLAGIMANAGADTVIVPQGIREKLTHYELKETKNWLVYESLLLPNQGASDLVKPDADDLAFLQYTSGTTETPKGVAISHRNIIHNVRLNSAAFCDESKNNVMISWLPPYHDMGLIGSILSPLYAGVTSILMAPLTFMLHPIKWMKAISDYQGTVSGGPNFAYDYCVERIKPEQLVGIDLSSWICCFSGAEPIHAATLQRFYHKFKDYGFRYESFFPCYGMAETTLFVSGAALGKGPISTIISISGLQAGQVRAAEDAADEYICISSGRPHLVVAIVDQASSEVLEEDQIGEIWVQGDSVAVGYWQNQQASDETFRATLANHSGYYLRTGDLGFMRDSELYVVGRLKDLIIIQGRNYYPQDIESVAQSSHPLMRAAGCAAFSLDEGQQSDICLVAEINDKGGQSHAEIVKRMRNAVAASLGLNLTRIVLIPPRALPKTTSGKIQRRKCRQMLGENELKVIFDEQAGTTLPPSDLEKEHPRDAITALLRQVLNLPPDQPINDHQNLFDMGLDSLRAVELSVHLTELFKVPLKRTVVFDHPTLEKLYRYIEGVDPKNSQSLQVPQDLHSFKELDPEQKKQVIESVLNKIRLDQI